MIRAAARLEADRAIPLMGQLARNDLKDAEGNVLPVEHQTSIQAFRALSAIGIPQQIERKAWQGDWSIFTPDELDRIVNGESPADIAERRRQLQEQEIVIDEEGNMVIEPHG
jgi:hypothetical protein